MNYFHYSSSLMFLTTTPSNIQSPPPQFLSIYLNQDKKRPFVKSIFKNKVKLEIFCNLSMDWTDNV